MAARGQATPTARSLLYTVPFERFFMCGKDTNGKDTNVKDTNSKDTNSKHTICQSHSIEIRLHKLNY